MRKHFPNGLSVKFVIEHMGMKNGSNLNSNIEYIALKQQFKMN